MKKLGISKLLGSLGLVAVLSTSSFGASLNGISLGADITTECEKLKSSKLNKDNQIVLDKKQNICKFKAGYDILKANHLGEIYFIGFSVTEFGLMYFDGPKSHAQKYINSKSPVVTELQYYKENAKEFYRGVDLFKKYQVTIDAIFIELEALNVELEAPRNFN